MERGEWHIRQNILLSRISSEMGRLFLPGHNAIQTEEYQHWVEAYRQAELEKVWHDWSDDYIPRNPNTCG